MAENLTHEEARNYPLSNGETADLIALVSTSRPADWVRATEMQPVGTVVYCYAMGHSRRGVVVKNTNTKTFVAITTPAAVANNQWNPGMVRVQTVTELHTTVYVAPAPVADEPEEFTEAERAALDEDYWTSGALDDAHAEALAIEAAESDEEDPAPVSAPPVAGAAGSSVVAILERVWALIRETHAELPDVVIVTGSAFVGPPRWGHFRAGGWATRGEKDAATNLRLGEMFVAGETLAKGARYTLETMLHEAAHVLAQARELKDTSRQGRWHNKVFRAQAEELGLEYRRSAADPQIGFSDVVLTDETEAAYEALLAELDAAISLTVNLPGFLAGTGQDGASGGERIPGGRHGGARAGGSAGTSSNNLKLVCGCEEPNIIRASRKVADKLVVKCDDCDELFGERSE